MSFIASGLGIAALAGVEGAADAALMAAGGEAIGAGIGALTNPQNRLKGALLGGVTGAVGGAATGGLGSLLGIGGEGAAATGDISGDVAANAADQAALNTTKAGLQDAAAQSLSEGTGVAGPPQLVSSAAPTSTLSTPTSMLTTAAEKMAPSAVLQGAGAIMNPPPTYGMQGPQAIAAQNTQAKQIQQQAYPGWQPQGAAKGGQLHLRDGSFIIPADVVSAIGNGSTKAGAQYLDHLFRAIHAGPAEEAGSLAKQRIHERHSA